MNTLFDAVITQDQRSLLTRIAGPWLATGEWPLWGSIQHYFDARRLDADEVFHSLSRVGVAGPFAAGYGFTAPMRAPISATDRVRLTVASSRVLPEVRMVVGEPFVRVLLHMVKLHADRPVSDHEVTPAQLRSAELMAAMPHLKPWFVQVLPDLLSYEPGISNGGGATLGDGTWERTIDRSVMQFRDVLSVEDYIARTCEIVTANAAQFAPLVAAVETPPVAEPERAPYIDGGLLHDLEEAAAKTRWKVHKLLALCRGLNDSYTAGNPYACAAMIRSILDHIPPLFGHADFKVVASQHVFTVKRTDKSHAQKLAAFKDIADDVMHRPIGPSVPRISMVDIPEPVRLNAVLQEVVAILR
ncbi:hypothetical protein [Streptomyces sp. A30]|uniref:hypothetical protein n=1 Tax=Streptomyces sp. A30 TaxID=2789273 RepID=UPI0039810CF9